MKKLFLVLAVAGLGMVACNNESTVDAAEQKRLDSIRTADSLDSIAKLTPPPPATNDTLPAGDTGKMATPPAK
jgi:hypothetical protein